MESFDAKIAPILWEENDRTISFAVWIYVYIDMFIHNDCRSTVVQRNFQTKFGKQPPSDIPFEGGMQSFKRQGACVFRNWSYQSESPLKPLPVTWYEQFGTNWIIVLMFVESQRVHI